MGVHSLCLPCLRHQDQPESSRACFEHNSSKTVRPSHHPSLYPSEHLPANFFSVGISAAAKNHPGRPHGQDSGKRVVCLRRGHRRHSLLATSPGFSTAGKRKSVGNDMLDARPVSKREFNTLPCPRSFQRNLPTILSGSHN